MSKFYRFSAICLVVLSFSASALAATDMEAYFETPSGETCGFNLSTITTALANAGCTSNKSSDAAKEVELAQCVESKPATFGGLQFRGLNPAGEGGRPNCFE
jgi:hypothetical protein